MVVSNTSFFPLEVDPITVIWPVFFKWVTQPLPRYVDWYQLQVDVPRWLSYPWATQRSRSTWPQGRPSWEWNIGGGVGFFILQLLRSKVDTNQNIMEYMTVQKDVLECIETRCEMYPLRRRNSFLKSAPKNWEDVQHHFPLQTSPITNNTLSSGTWWR